MVNGAAEAELERNRAALIALCEKYGVARLDVFGSATAAEWDPATSDLDFIVAFRNQPHRSLADRYLGLAQELEQLFGRRVDLLTERAIRNPYFRQAVEASRTPVYAG
jgi:predicted nucleotidyltransferase